MKIQLSDHFTYKKLFRFVIPTVVMMVFTSIYGVVDGFLCQIMSEKHPLPPSILLCPLLWLSEAWALWWERAEPPLVSKAMGQGEQEKAKRYFSMMIYFTVIMAVILSVVGIVFMEPVTRFLRATDEMEGYSVLYGRIVIAFTAAFMLQNVFKAFLLRPKDQKWGLSAPLRRD